MVGNMNHAGRPRFALFRTEDGDTVENLSWE